MTWLGKILTVVVFLGVIFWAYLTVQAFATRTNWKAEAEKYKDAYQKAVAARQAEYDRYRSKEETSDRLLAVERNLNKGLTDQVAGYVARGKESDKSTRELQENYSQADVKAIKLEAQVAAMTAEVAGVRKRNEELEGNAQRLAIQAQDALREMVRARNSERLAQQIADDNAKKVEDLLARISDMKSGGTGQGAVLRAINKPAPPVLPSLRGTVDNVAGDLLVISVGSDAGLAVGTTLDLIRENGSGRYLGKVKVTSAFNLFPKQAVVSFIPARDVPLSRLTAEELPKKGDTVRPPEALNGGQ